MSQLWAFIRGFLSIWTDLIPSDDLMYAVGVLTGFLSLIGSLIGALLLFIYFTTGGSKS